MWTLFSDGFGGYGQVRWQISSECVGYKEIVSILGTVGGAILGGDMTNETNNHQETGRGFAKFYISFGRSKSQMTELYNARNKKRWRTASEKGKCSGRDLSSVRRMQWTGPAMNMDQESKEKAVVRWIAPHGNRKPSRPKTGRVQMVKEDVERERSQLWADSWVNC